jgi:hypothetical protein
MLVSSAQTRKKKKLKISVRTDAGHIRVDALMYLRFSLAAGNANGG